MLNKLNVISKEVEKVLSHVNEEEINNLVQELCNADRIFIVGMGRSGLVGKMFAMRLMHSGYDVYAVGETITPNIDKNDLLVIISGSGNTANLISYAKKAKEMNAITALITTNKDAIIGKISELTVILPAATKKRLPDEPKTIQPLGSQFDQSAHLLLDGIIVELIESHCKNDSEKMIKKHTNLE
ncbi:6-phospho-3-hexuloisomerase [Virgibacillus sp. MSJ-26]|uniref:6-phospho-3-hexuloisomerase n=1 Tax=Virgibacillus sp. MSJ-26 TaxID=2841522 RepID=UPI001C119ED2|nr:6-phospho-3-hexuloisomerase [Virgibacillus sp. MSJ-26]MBU5468233.1 6-phospho-3-hexuloisomerase [Virgibacillus sp. MSJ-26]